MTDEKIIEYLVMLIQSKKISIDEVSLKYKTKVEEKL